MASDGPTSPIKRRLLAALPWFAIVAVGFYSYEHYGNDGVVGILGGIYGLGVIEAIRRADTEKASPLRQFVVRYRRGFMIAFLLGIVGGALDMFGLL